jgi:phosphoribulokinase
MSIRHPVIAFTGASSAGEPLVVIRFAAPRGVDFPYLLLTMIQGICMSRANILVAPGERQA